MSIIHFKSTLVKLFFLIEKSQNSATTFQHFLKKICTLLGIILLFINQNKD